MLSSWEGLAYTDNSLETNSARLPTLPRKLHEFEAHLTHVQFSYKTLNFCLSTWHASGGHANMSIVPWGTCWQLAGLGDSMSTSHKALSVSAASEQYSLVRPVDCLSWLVCWQLFPPVHAHYCDGLL